MAPPFLLLPGEERGRRHSDPSVGESASCHDGFHMFGGSLWIRGTRGAYTSKKKKTCRTPSWTLYGSFSDDDIDNQSELYVASVRPSKAFEKKPALQLKKSTVTSSQKITQESDSSHSNSEDESDEEFRAKAPVAARKKEEWSDNTESESESEDEALYRKRSVISFKESEMLGKDNIYQHQLKEQRTNHSGRLTWRCLCAKMQKYQNSPPSLFGKDFCPFLEDPMMQDEVDFGDETVKCDISLGISSSKTGCEIVSFSFHELSLATDFFSVKNWLQHSVPLMFFGEHPVHGVIAVRLFLRSDSSEVQIYERTLDMLRHMKFHSNLSSFLGICSEDSDFLCLIYEFPYQKSVSELLKNAEFDHFKKIKVLADVAKGLKYLCTFGNPTVILDANSVWLNDEGAAVVIDYVFGLTGKTAGMVHEFAKFATSLV